MTGNALEAARAAYEHHQDTAMDQQHSSVSAYIDALEASLQAMQARAEIAERERGAFRDMADGYGKLDAELAIAEARVKVLEEALKPFASYAWSLRGRRDDEHELGWLGQNEYGEFEDVTLTVGTFRRARTALKGDNHDL